MFASLPFRLLLSIGLLTGSLVTPALAQADAQPASAPATQKTETQKAVVAHPALWRVKDHGTTIYLFGTVHLLRPNVEWFNGPIRKAFDKSDEVVLEITDGDDKSTSAMTLQAAMAPDEPTVTSQLPADMRAAYAHTLQENGAPITFFDHVKPWFAAIALSTLPLKRLGYEPDSGVDRKIKAAASAAGKQLVGLETAQEQLGYFEHLPQALQVNLLVETLKEQASLPETISQMMDAWIAGKPKQLAAVLNQSMESSPELEQLLLVDRNTRWADWIKARLKTPGTVFIAVGAGHLAGKNSVQQMLAERGITVKRIKTR